MLSHLLAWGMAARMDVHCASNYFSDNFVTFSVPKDNVATLDKSASVQDGVSRSRHALLNGDTSNYDWDSGYTCHQLGSGSICVQLGQPYAIDSMK